jgi:carbon-monoxide dehydrogenase medium subunit
LGAVGPTPFFVHEAGTLLAGKPVSEEAIEKAAQVARSIAKPIDDMRGTREFRLHVTAVLTRRVLEEAVQRARMGG